LDFNLCDVRLKTFEDWPKYFHIKAETLARAGFCYTGIGDLVKCFACGVTLNNWEYNDVPEDEHYKFSPSCPYIRGIYCPLPVQEIQDKINHNNFIGKQLGEMIADLIKNGLVKHNHSNEDYDNDATDENDCEINQNIYDDNELSDCLSECNDDINFMK